LTSVAFNIPDVESNYNIYVKCECYRKITIESNYCVVSGSQPIAQEGTDVTLTILNPNNRCQITKVTANGE